MITKALTLLDEEEKAFKKSVRQFAETVIRPRVREMDRNAEMSPEVIEQLFAQGLMGLDIPAQHGGRGVPYFQSILAIEEWPGWIPPCPCASTCRTCSSTTCSRAGEPTRRRGAICPCSPPRPSARSRSPRSSRQRRLQHGRSRHARRRLLRHQRAQALDHQRRRSWYIHRLRQHDARQDPRHHRFPRRAQDSRTPMGAKEDKLGIRASSTCELLFENCRVPRAGCSASSARATRSPSRG